MLLAVLVAVVAGAYLNLIGVPGFLKQRLVDRLRAHGLELNFSRLRLRYYRGLVAENVHCGGVETNGAAVQPSFSAGEVELKLDHAALRHFNFLIDSLIVHEGKLTWSVQVSNEPPRRIVLNGIETRIRFRTNNDEWDLDRFTAGFAGTRLQLFGSVTNAPAIRDWKMFRPGQAARPEEGRRLARAIDTLDQIKFADSPEIKMFLRGDGRDPRTFNGRLTITTAGAETPWGRMTNGFFVLMFPPLSDTNEQPHGEMTLHAEGVRTLWGTARQFTLHSSAAAGSNLMPVKLELQANRVSTRWAAASDAHLTVDWSQSLTNPIPVAGRAELRVDSIRTQWGEAGSLRADARLRPSDSNAVAQPDASWSWWADLAPYALDWDCHVNNLSAEDKDTQFFVQELVCGGGWCAPELTITNFHTELYRGQLTAAAALSVATRRLSFEGNSDFDAEKISPLLTPHARQWLHQYSWEQPPKLRGSGEVILPAWTNREPDWREEVLPTLKIAADVEAGSAAYRTVPVTSARTHITFTNLNWYLPDLVATRPEGEVHLMHKADDRTHEYYFRIHSTIDVKALRPLLAPREQPVLDWLLITKPPTVDAEVWGRWHDDQSTGMKAQLAITNFSFRGESADTLRTSVLYSNHLLLFERPLVGRNGGYATADKVAVDFDARQLFLTNALSTIEPGTIIHPIGPMVTRDLEPYQFLQPPTVRANGIIPIQEGVPADVHFQVDGGPFRWQKFNVAHIAGNVNWVADHLTITDVKADFYGGHLTGEAAFDLSADVGTPFNFDVIATDTNLKMLMSDLFSPTNHLEGTFNCHLNITNANTDDWKSWFGQGQLDLHNGLIWEIPIFGVLSKPLDNIAPGLGKSRASEGSGTFIITNSIIRSEDLDIRSPVLRLLYRGTVDFDARTQAIVEGQLGRNIPLLGPIVSLAFMPFTKIFEYKITGSLGDPKLEPVWVPVKIFYLPGYLMHGLKGMFSGSGTNAPPAAAPSPKPETGADMPAGQGNK